MCALFHLTFTQWCYAAALDGENEQLTAGHDRPPTQGGAHPFEVAPDRSAPAKFGGRQSLVVALWSPSLSAGRVLRRRISGTGHGSFSRFNGRSWRLRQNGGSCSTPRAVYANEVVTPEKHSSTALLFSTRHGAVGASSDVVLDRYVYDQQHTARSRSISGFARHGQMKNKGPATDLKTPSGVHGDRGTLADHLCDEGGQHLHLCSRGRITATSCRLAKQAVFPFRTVAGAVSCCAGPVGGGSTSRRPYPACSSPSCRPRGPGRRGPGGSIRSSRRIRGPRSTVRRPRPSEEPRQRAR